MISPSPGVKPIEVSTERPWLTAQSDEPLPRWQLTRRNAFGRCFKNCAARKLTPDMFRAVFSAVREHLRTL